MLSPLPGYLNIKKNRLMHYIKGGGVGWGGGQGVGWGGGGGGGGLQGTIFMKINKINTYMLY